jgi:hypothetical protein
LLDFFYGRLLSRKDRAYEPVVAKYARKTIGDKNAKVSSEDITSIVLLVLTVPNHRQRNIMEVKTTPQNTHQWGKVFLEKTDVSKVRCSRINCLLYDVVLKGRFTVSEGSI